MDRPLDLAKNIVRQSHTKCDRITEKVGRVSRQKSLRPYPDAVVRCGFVVISSGRDRYHTVHCQYSQ
jgi:hypothetical protein